MKAQLNYFISAQNIRLVGWVIHFRNYIKCNLAACIRASFLAGTRVRCGLVRVILVHEM